MKNNPAPPPPLDDDARQRLKEFGLLLAKDIDQLLGMNLILREDINVLLNLFSDDWTNQTLRRMVVRASWANFEAVAYGLKQATLKLVELASVEISTKERRILSESAR